MFIDWIHQEDKTKMNERVLHTPVLNKLSQKVNNTTISNFRMSDFDFKGYNICTFKENHSQKNNKRKMFNYQNIKIYSLVYFKKQALI